MAAATAQHRPAHAARRVSSPPRGVARELPARVGRARPARTRVVARHGHAHRRPRRGRGAGPAGRRLPLLRGGGRLRAVGAGAGSGPQSPREPLRRRRDARPLRPWRRGRGGARRRRGRGRSAARRRPSGSEPRSPLRRGAAPPPARPSDVRELGAHVPGAHSRGRRLPGRAEPARRAADLRECARALPRAPPGESVAVPLPARAREAGADRLLAGAARQLRGRSRQRLPDRRHHPPRRRRGGAAARLREGPRRARDARRPRPERPLARLCRRLGARRALHGRSASPTSRTSSRRSWAS